MELELDSSRSCDLDDVASGCTASGCQGLIPPLANLVGTGSNIYYLFSLEKKETEEEKVPTGLRRGLRTTKEKDHKAMHSGGGQLLSVGDTVMSKHMALNNHKTGDI